MWAGLHAGQHAVSRIRRFRFQDLLGSGALLRLGGSGSQTPPQIHRFAGESTGLYESGFSSQGRSRKGSGARAPARSGRRRARESRVVVPTPPTVTARHAPGPSTPPSRVRGTPVGRGVGARLWPLPPVPDDATHTAQLTPRSSQRRSHHSGGVSGAV